jgi:NitT/TauT family transport system ATP-binding protein
VTHDVEEAIGLADRVLLLSAHPARVIAEVPVSSRGAMPPPQELDAIREEIARRMSQAYS